MKKTVIDKLYEDVKELLSFLEEKEEISFLNTIDKNFRKTLLMASASYFEDRFKFTLKSFVEDASKDNRLLVEFVKNKAISRQYHTYFDWDAGNANRFFALFGDTFKNYMKSQIKDNDELNQAIKAFMEIGGERNRLVHQDFGAFQIEKTADEIYKLYKSALLFVERFPANLKSFIGK